MRLSSVWKAYLPRRFVWRIILVWFSRLASDRAFCWRPLTGILLLPAVRRLAISAQRRHAADMLADLPSEYPELIKLSATLVWFDAAGSMTAHEVNFVEFTLTIMPGYSSAMRHRLATVCGCRIRLRNAGFADAASLCRIRRTSGLASVSSGSDEYASVPLFSSVSSAGLRMGGGLAHRQTRCWKQRRRPTQALWATEVLLRAIFQRQLCISRACVCWEMRKNILSGRRVRWRAAGEERI